MKILIFEDEKLTAERLIQLISRYDESIQPLAVITTVRDGIEWFKTHSNPDLIFMDIHLGDGSCFELFRQVKIEVPIIFTTAYDEYALQAFKLNSVDYLVKPVDPAGLKAALDKFRKTQYAAPLLYRELIGRMNIGRKSRFLVKVGAQLKQVPVEEVAYFYYMEETVYLVTRKGNRLPLDYSLDQVQGMVDPATFFRINRHCICNHSAINRIHQYFNSRLKLELEPRPEREMIVSREKVQAFRRWLDS